MNHISSHYIKSSSSCSLLLLFQYYWDCAGFVVVVVAVGGSAVWKSTSLQLVAPRTSPQRRGGEERRLLLLAKQPMQPRTSIRIRISHKACTYIRTKYLLPPLQILHIYSCLCRQGRCYSGSTGCRFGCYSFPDQPTAEFERQRTNWAAIKYESHVLPCPSIRWTLQCPRTELLIIITPTPPRTTHTIPRL